MALTLKKALPPDSDINVTPLIDVVLVMLIIFMVAIPMKIEEIAINLPKNEEVQELEEMPEDQFIVAAYDDGTYALNKNVMALPDLIADLEHRLKFKKSPRVVFVDAHPDLLYFNVVEVMDAVRDAGAERVALARLKPEGPARAAPESELEGEAAEQVDPQAP